MLTKAKVIHAINKLPSEFSMDEIIDELLLIQKIENGLEQSKNDDVISDEELSKELPGWLN
ncbi:hypothetical protein [Reichenbachiella sp. MALMAid0571]|uniref:hypothetical protein n=1 Tax=Reichenbachiella sp. MALMAid0571 TaxID=3143939 RepID=UPI0032DEFC6F